MTLRKALVRYTRLAASAVVNPLLLEEAFGEVQEAFRAREQIRQKVFLYQQEKKLS